MSCFANKCRTIVYDACLLVELYCLNYFVSVANSISSVFTRHIPITYGNKIPMMVFSPLNLVFLDSAGEWFLEGILIQVRRVNDNVNPLAVGMFELEEDGDVFLQKINCFGLTSVSLDSDRVMVFGLYKCLCLFSALNINDIVPTSHIEPLDCDTRP